MAIGAGIAAQVGIANETVVNTPVAVTVFTAFTSEGLDRRPNTVQGLGLSAGALIEDVARFQEVSHDAGGPLQFNIPTKGFGKYAQAMMGSYATTATLLAGSAYQQIHNSGSADGKTFTCQVGAPSIDGVVNPKTLSGCKVNDWTLTAAPNGIVDLALTVDAMDIAPTGAGALALQTASYAAGAGLFGFNQVTFSTFAAYTTVAGLWTPTTPSTVVARNITFKGGQPKDNTRWGSGSSVKAEALVNDYQPITAQIDIDFGLGATPMGYYNQFAAATSIGVQINCTGTLIGGTNNYLLQLTGPAAIIETGATPKVTGPGIITVSYALKFKRDSLGNGLQMQIVSTDTSV